MSAESDKIAAVEKAIAEKYGNETVQNPKGNWDEVKEKDYLDLFDDAEKSIYGGLQD